MNYVYAKWKYISIIVLEVTQFFRIPMTDTALCVYNRYLYKLDLIQIFAQPFYTYY